MHTALSILKILSVMSSKRRLHLVLTLFLMLLVGIFEVVSIGAVVPVLAGLSNLDNAGTYTLPVIGFVLSEGSFSIKNAAILLIFASGFTAVLRLCLNWTSVRFITGLGYDIDVKIYENFLGQDYENYINANSSELVSAVEKVNVAVFGVFHPLFQGFVSVIIAGFIITFLLSLDFNVGFVAFTLMAFLYVSISVTVSRVLKKNSLILAGSQTERIRGVQEAFGAFRDIILLSLHSFFFNRFKLEDHKYRNSQGINAFIQTSPRIIVEGAAMTLLAVYALYAITQTGGLADAIPILGTMAIGAQRLLPLMQQTYYGWSAVQGSSELLSEIEHFCSRNRQDFVNDGDLDEVPFKDEISFEHVTYKYPNEKKKALHSIDLKIKKGEKVGIIGKTGSGKSTLVDLIMGLLTPVNGHIKVDAQILTRNYQKRWQKQIAHVPQSIYLSDDTIAGNIAFGLKSINYKKLNQVIKISQLEDVISNLPEGFNTLIGERGIRLSGGQKQRIGIARALYRDAKVIVLDEATSALDNITEQKLMEDIDQLGTSVTVIMIAHRISSLKNCQKIIKVSSGLVKCLNKKQIKDLFETK